MDTIEELSRMLEERGVGAYKHEAPAAVCLAFFDGNRWHDCWESTGGEVNVTFSMTPEQAIAATLGRGTCKIHDCEGSFSAVNRPVWRCDCGAFMTQYTDATTYHKPRYCPNCGRKVVDE